MNSMRQHQSLSFLLPFSLQLFLALSDDSQSQSQPASKDAMKTESRSHTPTNISSTIAIVLIALLLFSLFSILLFKLWQKKKREEQYARLLKLFEEDDELELELGLRD